MWRKNCSVENCWRPVKGKGWCSKHYQQFYKSHETYRKISEANKRKHPLYIIWWQRKQDNLLCEEWLNFENFINDVGQKPDGNYFLVRLREGQFSHDNFEWKERLQRRPEESTKDWNARQRFARISANPSMESDRNLKRTYGLSRKEYNEILKSQNNGCAICGEKETSIEVKTGTTRSLAVDHCHNSQKIRGLLCWRCNGTLGKINDNVELLQSMINYLLKHNGD